MKQISKEQIELIIKLAYDLNCPAPQWEALKKLMAELPDIQEETKKK